MRAWRALAALGVLGASGCPSWVDLETPRAYPCARDGGDGRGAGLCPSGWRCGLDGVCQDESVAAAYTCAANDDCEQGWHCGLSRVCHDPAVAAAYACRSDTECEQGWRCGLDGVCFDVSGDVIKRSAEYDINLGLRRTTRSPQLTTGTPTAFSAGFQTSLVTWTDRRRRPFAQVADGGVTSLVQFTGGGGGLGDAILWRQPLPNDLGHQEQDVTGLAAVNDDVYVLFRNHDLFRYGFDGGTVGRAQVTGPSLDGLRASALRPPQQGHVLAPVSTPLVFHVEAGGGSFVPSGLPPGTVLDVAFDSEDIRVVTTQGLFLNQWAFNGAMEQGGPLAGPWQPLCAVPALNGFRAVRVVPVEQTGADRYFGLELVPNAAPFNGGHGPFLADVFALYNTSGSCVTASVQGPAPACPQDSPPQAPKSVRMIRQGEPGNPGMLTHQQFEVRCPAAPDGGRPERTFISDNLAQGSWFDLVGADAVYRHPVIEQSSTPALGAWAGPNGKMWRVDPTDPLLDTLTLAPRQPDISSAVPLLLDQQPLAVVDLPGFFGLFASTSARIFPLVNGYGFMGSPDQVFPGQPIPAGTVDGRSTWGLTVDGQVADLSQFVGGLPHILATSTSVTTLPPPPYSAAAVTLPDGGTEVLYSAYDQLRAGDVTASLDLYTPPATLSVVLVPIPGIPILSFATLPPPAADGGVAPLLSGYAITPGNVFHFVAQTQSRWVEEELDVPIATPWVKVWSEGARARLGLQDGTVLSLPSKVPLSQPLPGATASDYQQLCGYTFAVSERGLYRLEPGTPLATWVQQDALGDFVTFEGSELPGARLTRTLGQMHVLGNSGRVVSLAPNGTASCP